MRKNWITALFLFISCPLLAQDGYKTPPQSIVDLALAPNETSVEFSATGNLMLLLEKSELMSLEQLSEKRIGLAGYRITPENNSIFNKITYVTFKIKNVKTGKEVSFKNLPSKPRFSDITISPNEEYIAFQQITKTGVELWIATIKTGEAKRLTNELISDISGKSFQWASNSNQILVQLVPKDRKFPIEPTIPSSPITQINLGRKTPARTHQNLLSNKYDDALFDYYATAQLTLVSLDGKINNIAKPAIYRSFDFSPDASYILSRRLIKPYSYTSPAGNFNSITEILDLNGKALRNLPNGKLQANRPSSRDLAAKGPRNYAWRSDKPATLFWVNAFDDGDPRKDVAFRDGIYTLNAPFTGEPEEFYKIKYRFANITWGNDQIALLGQRWREKNISSKTIINPSKKTAIDLGEEKDDDEVNANGGSYITQKNQFARNVLLIDSSATGINLYETGRKYTKGDIIPFMLRWNITTKKKDTIFRSKAPFYEQPITYFKDSKTLVIKRESVDETPNFFSINTATKKSTALTQFSNPYPQLKGISKQLIHFTRNDGIKLSGTLYLPKEYKKSDQKLPMLMWAYPREFKTTTAASRITSSPYLFTRISPLSPIYWVTRGYAVFDKVDMPVVGVGKVEPNDSYVEQITENAKAAIKAVNDLGVIDTTRIAVGGHSYGAFMTANLLAHTNLFAAGIASSGAYNRTLTPFGFQGERRNYWTAMETYNKMSTFNYADKIKTPILILHGQADENSGTFPIQSERLFAALQGLGGTSKLVLFPYEEHGYKSKESNLHRLYEMDLWLEKYVKNKKAK